MADPVLDVTPLGSRWATVDPFLFCVHHVDDYPAGNDALGPRASLAGRDLGQDFDGIDGWRMYHGLTVPGFPQHPHRGFETVTFVRRGFIDHSDSLGASARFGRGDVQWLTAGRGINHSEMFPLLEPDAPNPLELFQIWLNLPAAAKLVDPYFTMLWDDDLPRHVATDANGRTTQVTVIAGELAGVRPPPPPPDSWASHSESDLAIWHIAAEPGAQFELPPAATPDTVRVLYVFDGAARIGEHDLVASTGARLGIDAAVSIDAGSDGAEMLVLQGRPIGEPVAQYGPFVMNDRAGIEQALADYRETGFGGWPWPVDDPVHERAAARFARDQSGTLLVPEPVSSRG
jgi:redox-sensitive bicupin YhaK (pirin superfamily)